MAQITTAMMLARDVKQYVNSITSVSHSFSPTVIAATVTNGDRILLMTLPANAKVVGAALKLTGTSAATAIAHLQLIEPTSNAIFLTPTSGAAAAPSVAFATIMSQPHLPLTSVTGTRDLEIVVASGTISVTNGMVWYADVQYAFTP